MSKTLQHKTSNVSGLVDYELARMILGFDGFKPLLGDAPERVSELLLEKGFTLASCSNFFKKEEKTYFWRLALAKEFGLELNNLEINSRNV